MKTGVRNESLHESRVAPGYLRNEGSWLVVAGRRRNAADEQLEPIGWPTELGVRAPLDNLDGPPDRLIKRI